MKEYSSQELDDLTLEFNFLAQLTQNYTREEIQKIKKEKLHIKMMQNESYKKLVCSFSKGIDEMTEFERKIFLSK